MDKEKLSLIANNGYETIKKFNSLSSEMEKLISLYEKQL